MISSERKNFFLQNPQAKKYWLIPLIISCWFLVNAGAAAGENLYFIRILGFNLAGFIWLLWRILVTWIIYTQKTKASLLMVVDLFFLITVVVTIYGIPLIDNYDWNTLPYVFHKSLFFTFFIETSLSIVLRGIALFMYRKFMKLSHSSTPPLPVA